MSSSLLSLHYCTKNRPSPPLSPSLPHLLPASFRLSTTFPGGEGKHCAVEEKETKVGRVILFHLS